jgi:hypothetical protein
VALEVLRHRVRIARLALTLISAGAIGGVPAYAASGPAAGPTDGSATERETLDRLEAEVFDALGGGESCLPGEPGCGPTRDGLAWLDTPEPIARLAGAPPGEFLRGTPLSGFTVPVVLNGPVKAYLRFFQGRGKYILARWLARMGRHRQRLETLLAKEDAPPELVFVAMIESGFDPTAVSHAQAVGPWQFVLKSGQAMGLRRDAWLDERRSWERSTQAAARYLKMLQKKFGSWPLALAAYNCGPGTVARAIESTGERDFWVLAAAGALPLGTTRYVPKIMAAMIIGRDPARYGFDQIRPEAPITTATVHLAGGRDLRALARALDLSEDTLADLNPELRRGFTPPGVTEWPVVIPESAVDRFHEHVDAREIQGRVFAEHVVRFGERLKDVAAARGVTQTALRRLNELPEGEPRAGQTILVPADGRPVAPGPAPLLVRTDPGLQIDPLGRQEVFFPVTDKMEVGEIAAFFQVSPGDVGLWNGLDPQAPVHRGMALRLFVAPDFDLSRALVVPARSVTAVTAGSAAAGQRPRTRPATTARPAFAESTTPSARARRSGRSRSVTASASPPCAPRTAWGPSPPRSPGKCSRCRSSTAPLPSGRVRTRRGTAPVAPDAPTGANTGFQRATRSAGSPANIAFPKPRCAGPTGSARATRCASGRSSSCPDLTPEFARASP